ncbi:hypothetical protein MKJ04_11495 [Pontibacter sp. E15-1]|uniref:hypothetical protein n=1 Tax=Pontibacter sp. E15-1 TaxID=2919918 RepID=UPI001F4FB763|nr:hypothetical protein [Pontibacter sp. E15-1]MCJ8165468.1 hypothetical protein [Pontibacter sp. E15-1]
MKNGIEIPKERVLMGCNYSKLKEYADELQGIAEAADTCVQLYSQFNVGPITKQELVQLAKGNRTADALVREKLVGNKHVEVQGLTLDVEQLKKLVVMPNLAGFEAAVHVLRERSRIASSGSKDRININAVEIEDGVANCDAAIAKVQEAYSYYAETDDEKEAYLVLLQVQEQLQYLADKFGLSVIDHGDRHASVLVEQGSWDGPKTYTINGTKLKSRLS